MSKNKEKAPKAVASSYEDAQTQLEATREELKILKEERKEYFKKNELKGGEDYSQDAKHGKKITKMDESIEAKKALIEELKAFAKENKPKKERTPRETSYDYPKNEDGSEMTAAQKKKFRAKARAEKKKAAKGEATAETTTGEAKATKSKKDKKEKKEAAAAADD